MRAPWLGQLWRGYYSSLDKMCRTRVGRRRARPPQPPKPHHALKGGIGEAINEKDAAAVCEVAVLSTHNILVWVSGWRLGCRLLTRHCKDVKKKSAKLRSPKYIGSCKQFLKWLQFTIFVIGKYISLYWHLFGLILSLALKALHPMITLRERP